MRPISIRRSRIEEPALMSSHYPFYRNASLTVAAVAALLALAPASVPYAHAQIAKQAALSDAVKSEAAKPEAAKSEVAKSEVAKSEAAKTAPSQTTTGATGGNVAATNQANPAMQTPPRQNTPTGTANDKVQEAANTPGDIFRRLP